MVDRYRVLLVDDDGPLLASLGDLLQRDGFDVTTARSGREALAALDAAWPDLVLLELAMPGMSGQELAAHIKKRADIPIIVLSSDHGGGEQGGCDLPVRRGLRDEARPPR